MLPGDLKPVLAALVLPPAGLLLLLLLGLAVATRRRAAGLLLVLVAVLAFWFLACNAVAVRLAHQLLPMAAAVQPEQVRQVQAIVVLGGGVDSAAPEYGVAQPRAPSLQRIRYGAWLARHASKPLAFAGGLGWAAPGSQADSEAAVARRVLLDDYGISLRWADERSRDTHENALRMAEQLLPAGIRRIALVTHATHMPRAVAHFRAVGFEVLPAPTVWPAPEGNAVLEWLPSTEGLALSRQVLREWLGGRLLAPRQP
jgi:uncharacterized SAM-binding protein YcdF (DUF218 family)